MLCFERKSENDSGKEVVELLEMSSSAIGENVVGSEAHSSRSLPNHIIRGSKAKSVLAG